MMPEKDQTQTRYQIATTAAGESVESLLTVYWADSFDADPLQNRLTETIAFFTRNSRKLEEPHPYPQLLEEQEGRISTSQVDVNGKGV